MENVQHQEFSNALFGRVRCINENGVVIFCGSDVAGSLGYSRPNEAVTKHCKGTLKRRTLTKGGEQTMVFITEGDAFRLIVRSKLPSAVAFERWLMDDVLPTMRKTGGYVVTEDLFLDTYLPGADDNVRTLLKTTLAAMRQQSHRLEEQAKIIEAQKPAVQYVEAVSESESCLSIREFSKMLHEKERVEIGQIRLFSWLRKKKYLDDGNLPYQQYQESGYFKVVQRARFVRKKKKYEPYLVTLVTGKGQVYFTHKLLEAPPEEYNTLKGAD